MLTKMFRSANVDDLYKKSEVAHKTAPKYCNIGSLYEPEKTHVIGGKAIVSGKISSPRERVKNRYAAAARRGPSLSGV
jgi:hypothetical protein